VWVKVGKVCLIGAAVHSVARRPLLTQVCRLWPRHEGQLRALISIVPSDRGWSCKLPFVGTQPLADDLDIPFVVSAPPDRLCGSLLGPFAIRLMLVAA